MKRHIIRQNRMFPSETNPPDSTRYFGYQHYCGSGVMRFKAKLAPEQVALLYALIVPLSKLSSSSGGGSADASSNLVSGEGGVYGSLARHGSILYMDSRVLRFTVKGNKFHDTDGINCYAELTADGTQGIFLEHRIESNAPDNGILMEIDLGQLRMALQSVVSSENSGGKHGSNIREYFGGGQLTVLKLAKRHMIPCLCLESCTSRGTVVQVLHTIPVRVLRVQTELPHYAPPTTPIPDIQLTLGPTHSGPLRTICERLLRSGSTLLQGTTSGAHATVYLTAKTTGELIIHHDGDGVSVRTFLSKLPVVPNPDTDNPPPSCTIKVDAKKLFHSLGWQPSTLLHGGQRQTRQPLLCLVRNEMLVVHVHMHPASTGFFTYYVPVHFLSDEEGDPTAMAY
jgi:Hus1-like protein